ncbi:MAG: hypothetical protein JJ863_09985 [Deltaproteobacteria bacterium]|nr:hypothetical protein [Deltaproteobacteria bacterium]
MLFDEVGAPDPRGLPLHEVVLETRPRSEQRIAPSRELGWVLPGGHGGRKFVITLGGQIEWAARVGDRVHDPRALDRNAVWFAEGIALAFAVRSGMQPRHPPLPLVGAEVYVREWSSYGALQAFLAFHRGDTDKARATLEMLLPAARDPRGLADCELIGGLLADLDRRRDARPPSTADGPPPARARTLIARLEQMTLPLTSNRYGEIEQSEVGQRLIALGDAAVEPLIEELESGVRLTRVARMSEGWVGLRMLSVGEVSLVLLERILRRSFGDPFSVTRAGDVALQHRVAAQVREHWTRYGALPLVERFYRELANDELRMAEWSAAAVQLLLPPDWLWVPDLRGVWPPPGMDRSPSHLGEPLRDGRSPSVSDLLRRRLDSIREMGPKECALMAAATRWDPDSLASAVLPLMSRAFDSERCYALLDLVIQLRERSPTVLRRYVRWLESGEGPDYHSVLDSLEPFRDVELEPRVERRLRKLLNRRSWREALDPLWLNGDCAEVPLVGC